MDLELCGEVLSDGSIKWLTVEDLIRINREQILQGPFKDSEPIAVLSMERLESSQSSPAQYRYYKQTDDMFELASVLMFSLINNHCFANGNKRTATQATFDFLLMNGYRIPPLDETIILDMVVGVASKKYDREYIENWLAYYAEEFDTRLLCVD